MVIQVSTGTSTVPAYRSHHLGLIRCFVLRWFQHHPVRASKVRLAFVGVAFCLFLTTTRYAITQDKDDLFQYSFSDQHLHGSYDAFMRASNSPTANESFEVSRSVNQVDVPKNETARTHNPHPAKNDSARRRQWKKLMDQDFKPQELLIPCEDFERIELLGRLGEGKRKATDEGRYNGLDVVVKKIKVERYNTSQDLKNARRHSLKEAAVLYQLRNASNIMRMIGYCNYTMVVNGVMTTSLLDLIEDGEIISTHRKLEVSVDVARSLQQVHELGFMHNDIKPGHFLVNKEGKVLLDDFDQVRIPVAGGLQVPDFVSFSTNQYRPPEEFAGKLKDLSSDIYSLSLVLWSLWANCGIPYPIWDDEKCADVGSGRLRPNLAGLINCPEPLQRLLVQAWDQDPSRRPTASQTVQQLESLLELYSKVTRQRSIIASTS